MKYLPLFKSLAGKLVPFIFYQQTLIHVGQTRECGIHLGEGI